MCTRPNYALYIESNDPEIKSYMKFIKVHPEDNYKSLKAKYGNNLLSLPCGQCEQCRKDYATTWAVRCSLEASKYKNNWFITLTYDNKHYKPLNKEDIQDFLNNLNPNHEKVDFKYWLAGEIGPTTGRAHYHMILMNYDIKGKPITKSPLGNMIYQSSLIERAWGRGYVEIQEAGENAMAYVAKYAVKGTKEFNFKPMMSKGIGLTELEINQDFINEYGYIQGPNGKKYKIPRYYFKKFENERSKLLKKRQKAKAIQETAKKVRRQHLEIALKQEEQIAELTKGRRNKI